MNDILINKMATIQRCLKRINEEFNIKDEQAEEEFRLNFTKQDSLY